jgi:hypothetical protein
MSCETLCLIVGRPCKPTNFDKKTKRQQTAQMAHLVFADTQPNAEKLKELFFANAPTEKLTLN